MTALSAYGVAVETVGYSFQSRGDYAVSTDTIGYIFESKSDYAIAVNTIGYTFQSRGDYAVAVGSIVKPPLVAVAGTNAAVFADEYSHLSAPIATTSAAVFADEITRLVTPPASKAAAAFADENTIVPKNPYKMMTYNSTTGEYEPAPWYIYDKDAGIWRQAV